MAAQQAAYTRADVDESEPAVDPKRKKRKTYTGVTENEDSSLKKAKPTTEKKKKNTAIYVSGLPKDITVDELKTTFSKCGQLAQSIDTGASRIKIYTDTDGTCKGDALIIFHREESVDIAIQLMNETEFRFGTGMIMKVQEAEAGRKKGKSGGEEKMSSQEKKKLEKRLRRLNNKLGDWSDEESQPVSNRWSKVVILKHMFTLQELEDDPTTILDLKQDIWEESEKIGTVTNVVIFDREPEGIVSVRFTNESSAEECIKKMDGRFFGGMQVEAFIHDGRHYKKSKSDDEGNEEERLKKFGNWLEEEDSK